MRLFKIAVLTAVAVSTAATFAADIASDIKKLQGKAGDFAVRDRKGEPLDVMAEKTAGEKPRLIQTPVVPPSATAASTAAPTQSRLELWKQRRQQQQQAASQPASPAK